MASFLWLYVGLFPERKGKINYDLLVHFKQAVTKLTEPQRRHVVPALSKFTY